MSNYRNPRYYILDDAGEPQAVDDLMAWARWRESAGDSWIVRKTDVDGAEVSTVFLAQDHRYFGESQPLLYETMIFGGEHDAFCVRYCTRAEAAEGHERIVAALREERDPGEASS